ncbi:type II toxin-antitoxin system RelE/ParE family toxin [Marinomonas sp. C2222]|uniref:Type II toxin-antitoxin system RelE/ParE family toxin n=1 Tax=Marinomonas sargassi TaxID=2984494 RepID=A0ABT2YPB9_9GAMM|nr:type II toxin-antitoxin system RelE/ParE family toxin [Marinomonas sargassi]MCV2401733.1 type II toxin-antitoxin system RelE/ParE family toxin [Marinomonas sargassi]
MILWEKEALKDRGKLFEYLFQFNPSAAEKTDDILIRKIENLLHQPLIGIERENLKGRLLITPEISMLVSYYIDKKDIQILRILHMRQKFPI